MEAVRAYAVKEGGEVMGQKVSDLLANVTGSVQKAIALWEKSG